VKDSEKFNIVVLGPDRRKGGGIATVIHHLYSGEILSKFHFIYIPTQINQQRWKKLLQVFKAFVMFWGVYLSKPIGLVHIHSASRISYFRKSIFLLLSKLMRKKVVFHIHAGAFYDFYQYECSRIMKWYVRKTLNLADRVIVLSTQWSKKLSIMIEPARIKVIPNPVDIPLENYRIMAKDMQCIKILFMGKLVEKKGVYDLISIAERLVVKYQNVKFVLAGTGETEKIKIILKQKGLEPYFELPGWVENKDFYYKEADIFVLPSYVEALPMVILEAASYGLPIVSTTVGAIPEVIESKKSGFLLEPGAVEGFAEKLGMLLEDKEMRRRMGETARQQMTRCFAKEKISSQFAQLYLSLMEVSR
jgi:glycosyltransferase involved in cell wall biosynthesis